MSNIQSFDYNIDPNQALLWQYNNATNLKAILNNEKAFYDLNNLGFWNDWYTDVFNLATANDFGLAVWSIILGQSLYSSYQGNSNRPSWGFSANNLNFENGNFGSITGGNNVYSTEVARVLLQLRYFQLTGSGTVPEINRMLAYVFKNYGQVYLQDNLDMTQTYIFNFSLSSEMSYMLNNTDVLQRPAGVMSAIIQSTLIVITDSGDFVTTDAGSQITLG